MSKLYLLLCLIFSLSKICAQRSIQLPVYFDTDQALIKPIYKQKIDSLLTTVEQKELLSVVLYGNTDSRADSLYNYRLSQRRIASVRAYLLSKNIATDLITEYPLGEAKPIASNETKAGRQLNRRVEVMLQIKVIPSVVEVIPSEKDTCFGDTLAAAALPCLAKDTTINFPNGTLATLDVCDYYKVKDCLIITEYITPEAARAAGLTTMSRTGQPLISIGMLQIQHCLEEELCMKIYLPWSGNNDRDRGEEHCDKVYDGMTLWTGRTDGSWDDIGEPFVSVMVDSLRYYEASYCAENNVFINGDKMMDCPKSKKEIFVSRVKLRKGLKVIDARLAFESPYSIYVPLELFCKKRSRRDNLLSQRRIKRQTKFRLPRVDICTACSGPMLHVKAVNPAGDTLVFDYAEAAPYHRITANGTCKGEKVKQFLGLFPIKEKVVYRKYILRPKDFRPWKGKEQEWIGMH